MTPKDVVEPDWMAGFSPTPLERIVEEKFFFETYNRFNYEQVNKLSF